MEKFLALCLCLPLMIIFIPQYGLQTQNTAIINQSEVIVDAAKEQAKQKGYFTDSIINGMRADFTAIGVDSNRVIIRVTQTPKYRTDVFDSREMIDYEIGVPIDKIIATNHLFGIVAEENKKIHYLRGQVASERLP